MRKLFLFIIAFILAFQVYSQSYTLEKLKAIHLYVFASYIEWPQADSSEVFKICIVGNETELFNEVEEVTNAKFINNKTIVVDQLRKPENIPPADIVYISPAFNYNLKNLYSNLTKNQTLLVTENADIRYSMINFLYKDNTLKFEINEVNMEMQKLQATNRLLAMVKSKDELQEMYVQLETFLESQKNIIEEQKRKISQQEYKLQQQISEIESQKAQLQGQKLELELQKTQIDSQNMVLNNLAEDIQIQQSTLLRKTQQLNEQERILQEQESNIEAQKAEQAKLDAYNSQLKTEARNQEQLIDQQKNILDEQILRLRTQRNILIFSIIIAAIIAALAIQVYRGYSAKKKINNQLREKNQAIARQKEEIEYQAQKLEISNKELEKLSIVASKTDNAVIIMNPKGDFEWVNEAYKRLYGYTVDDLFRMKNRNILSADPNINLNDLINIWFKNKKAVTLESEKESKKGKKIWVQTTLTPILDSYGEIAKLVAIDTDISKLKATEKELIKQINTSDQLLLNILPKKVAEELKQKGVTTPETFDNVAVMFSDFVDFTKYASTLDPKELISELNEIYTAFDDIIGKHNCERIKTIGDAYMAVSGMHKKVENPALNLTRVALEIIDYLKKRNKKHSNQWETRIGIHQGKLVGGVVGVRKYIYDIFGDTINVASRMEFHSEVMKINVSEEIYHNIKNKFTCEKRDAIEVKGKGLLSMYYVHK